MANTIVTTDLVAREVLRVAHEKLRFLKTINMQYDDYYKGTGAMHGQSLRIKNPNEYNVRSGRVMDVNDQTELAQTLTVSTQKGVDMRVNSAEMVTDIDAFSKDHIEPATKKLLSIVEADVLQGATKLVANHVGTAGTVPGASGDISMIGQARARLNQFLAPEEDRCFQIDSDTMASIVNGNKSIFHDGPQVSKAFREGYYSRAFGMDWYENEKILALLNGTDHTTVTINDASIASGDVALTIAGGNFTAGSVFTLGSGGTPVYAVHPETKTSYSFLKQFVAAASGTTAMTMPTNGGYISTGAKQNVSNLPVTTDAVTFFGTANTTYKNALAYQKDFCTFVTADLPIMGDAAKCTVRSQEGLTVRVWEGSDIRNDEMLMRIDILYGYAVLRPEWACRVNCT